MLSIDIEAYNILTPEQAEHVGSHSLRIGRAVDIAKADVPHDLIIKLGRWTSWDTIALYLTKDHDTIFTVINYQVSMEPIDPLWRLTLGIHATNRILKLESMTEIMRKERILEDATIADMKISDKQYWLNLTK